MKVPSEFDFSPYRDLFIERGSNYDIDPALLGALAATESGLNPRATSRVGARGLFQFMPSTFEAFADKGMDPFNPEHSTEVASRYLRHLFDQFDGDPVMAIAAYNAGPTKVRRAVRRYGDKWLSTLPRETRNHVERVLRRQKEYAPIFQVEKEEPEKPVRSVLFLDNKSTEEENKGIIDLDKIYIPSLSDETRRFLEFLEKRKQMGGEK